MFLTIYGLTAEEMPDDDIVVRPMESLVAASDQNGCDFTGYVCFVRGRHPSDAHVTDGTPEEGINNTKCKEARVAEIYRRKVYHPFIRRMRMKEYGWDGEGDVPAALRVVLWMDGANGQLKLITSKDMLELEEELKIVVCKHNAARTGVEQAANVT